jgi:hypothetical protein
MRNLRDDLASGRWEERNRDLLHLDAAELESPAYRLIPFLRSPASRGGMTATTAKYSHIGMTVRLTLVPGARSAAKSDSPETQESRQMWAHFARTHQEVQT